MLKPVVWRVLLSLVAITVLGCADGRAARGMFTGRIIGQNVDLNGERHTVMELVGQTAPNFSTGHQKDTGSGPSPGFSAILTKDSDGNLYPWESDLVGKNVRIEGVLEGGLIRSDDKLTDNWTSLLHVKKLDILPGGFDGFAARGNFTGRVVPRIRQSENGEPLPSHDFIIFTAPN